MSRVALIFPYFRTRALTEMLFPPLGLANLAAQLRLLKVETKVFDCTFSTIEELERGIEEYRPDIVGIYSMISLNRNTFRIVEMVRACFPECVLVAGGPMPTLYPRRFGQAFDLVFKGECDLSFPKFCADFMADGTSRSTLANLPLDSYDGLYANLDDHVIDNPAIHYSENDIQKFPFPDRNDFDHLKYQKVWLDKIGSKTTSIMMTLGCPFNCDFCSRPIFGNVFRRRNLDAVAAEIEEIRELGYDSLWIADDNFTLSHSYLTKFCQGMVGKEIKWSCLSRVSRIDEVTAKMMKEAGCQRVYLGLETGSDETLRLMNKKAGLDEGINAVHQFRKAGIETAAFFIVGYPGETVASIEKTFKLALSLPLDEISFNVPYPLPGSRLFDRVSGIDEEKDWDKENEVTFVYNSEFDEAWLREKIGKTMQEFMQRRE